MNSYEKESLFKNFIIFFVLLELFLIILFFEFYHSSLKEYKQQRYKDMEVCSYTLKCKKYAIDFVNKENSTLYKLYDANEGLYAFFRLPKSKKFHLKLLYLKKYYEEDKEALFFEFFWKFIGATVFLLLLAFLLTLYSLKPIRKALKINDEFIKDILHDFNTPITSMVLNIAMLGEKEAKNPFIKRVQQGLDTIVLLQNNLKGFLHASRSQSSLVDVALLGKERLEFMENIYPHINFVYEKKEKLLKLSNKDLLIRILDNLLSNAAKYNKMQGEVKLTISKNCLIISDTGKGIKDVKKVLERYQTEQERGIGIGLHVVNKLIYELGVVMTIESQVNVGTEVTLDFGNVKGGG